MAPLYSLPTQLARHLGPRDSQLGHLTLSPVDVRTPLRSFARFLFVGRRILQVPRGARAGGWTLRGWNGTFLSFLVVGPLANHWWGNPLTLGGAYTFVLLGPSGHWARHCPPRRSPLWSPGCCPRAYWHCHHGTQLGHFLPGSFGKPHFHFYERCQFKICWGGEEEEDHQNFSTIDHVP